MANLTSQTNFNPTSMGRSSGRILGILTFLIAVISLIGVLYVGLMSGAPLKVPNKTMLTEAMQGSQARVEINDFKQTQAALEKTQATLAELKNAQSNQQQALSDLQNTDTKQIKLAETEYLLRLANHRVQLIDDIDGGIGLLEAADKTLAEQNLPGMLKVRKAIGEDLATLKALPKVDVEGVYSQLSALSIQTTKLPQFSMSKLEKDQVGSDQIADQQKEEEKMVEQLTAANTESAESFAEKVKAASSKSASNLWQRIGINYHSDFKAEPILSPEQHQIFTQNVRLLIEQAKVALLTGEQAVFVESLKEADELLAEHAQKVAQATTMRETLVALQDQNVEVKKPDVLKSIQVLLGSTPSASAKKVEEKETVVEVVEEVKEANANTASIVESEGAAL